MIEPMVYWFLICKNRKVYYSLKSMHCKIGSQTSPGYIVLTYLVSCNFFQELNMQYCWFLSQLFIRQSLLKILRLSLVLQPNSEYNLSSWQIYIILIKAIRYELDLQVLKLIKVQLKEILILIGINCV